MSFSALREEFGMLPHLPKNHGRVAADSLLKQRNCYWAPAAMSGWVATTVLMGYEPFARHVAEELEAGRVFNPFRQLLPDVMTAVYGDRETIETAAPHSPVPWDQTIYTIVLYLLQYAQEYYLARLYEREADAYCLQARYCVAHTLGIEKEAPQRISALTNLYSRIVIGQLKITKQTRYTYEHLREMSIADVPITEIERISGWLLPWNIAEDLGLSCGGIGPKWQPSSEESALLPMAAQARTAGNLWLPQ